MPRNPNTLTTISPLDRLQQRLGMTPIPTLVNRDTAFQSAIDILLMDQQLVNDKLTVGMIPVLESYAANLVGWRRTLMINPAQGRSIKPWEREGSRNAGSRNSQGQQRELENKARRMVNDPIFCIDTINSILDRIPKTT